MLSAIVTAVTTSSVLNSALELTTPLATQSVEENTTAILANHNVEQLQDGLTQAGFHAGALHCQQGKPPHIMPIDTLLTGTISLLDPSRMTENKVKDIGYIGFRLYAIRQTPKTSCTEK